MVKIAYCFFVLLSFSCANHQANFSQAEKCKVDGANIYVKCTDGRQQVFALGFGTFHVLKNGQMALAKEFCEQS
jgi:hypothetical protein